MTNQEAIETIDSNYPPENYSMLREALDMAIALLKEQEPKRGKPDCEHAEHDKTGCLGYCGCTQDDEPIESCKRCEKYTGNVSEAVNGND